MNPKPIFLPLLAALTFAFSGSPGYAQDEKADKKKTVPAAPGAIAPTKGDLPKAELESDETMVNTVIFYLDDISPTFVENNPFGKDPFGLPHEILRPALVEVVATVKKTPGSGPMQVAFPVPNPDRVIEIRALLDGLAAIYGSWPQDAVVTIDVDFGPEDTPDDPSMLTIAALLHSLIKGEAISSNLVVSGDLGDDLSVVPSRANQDGAVSNGEMIESIIESSSYPMRYIRAPMGYHELNDFAIDGDWQTLASLTLITVPTLAEALRVSFITNVSDLGVALSGFERAQAAIKKGKSSVVVKSESVQKRVIAAGRALRTNQSAVFYAMYARGKVPRTYSPEHSYTILKGYHDQVRGLITERPSNAKAQFNELRAEQKMTVRKISRDMAPLLRALGDFQSMDFKGMSKTSQGSALEQQREDVKKADAKVVAQLKALAAKIRSAGTK
jgi:hypothetical protein